MQGFWQRVSQPIQQLPTEERLIIFSVVLACLIAIAVYVIRRVRGEIYSALPPVTDHLSEFRRMREAGQLDEQEYSRVVQTISTVHEPDEPTFEVADPAPGVLRGREARGREAPGEERSAS